MVHVLVVKGHQALVTYYGHPQRAQRIITRYPMVDAGWSRNALAPRTPYHAPRIPHPAKRTANSQALQILIIINGSFQEYLLLYSTVRLLFRL